MKTLIIAYLILATIIAVEHRLFAYRWRHYELARRTMGIATVLAWALLLALNGHIDTYTWTIITVAFGIAGAMIGALYTNEAARRREIQTTYQRELLKALEAANDNTSQDQQHPARILREHNS